MPLEKSEIFNALCVYRELGRKFGRLEKFEKSLPYFDQALKRSPEDVRALLGRARCRAQACKYIEALKDLETVHSLYPENIYTYTSECLIKYLCCEFEEALVENLIRSSYRKKPDNFVLGAMHCDEAIRNNIGLRAGHPLRDHYLIIRKLAWLKVFEKSKPHDPKSRFKRKKKECGDETSQLAAPKMKFPIPEHRHKTKDDRKSLASTGSPSILKKIDLDIATNLLNEDSSIVESLQSDVEDQDQQIPPVINFPFRPIQRYTTNIQNLMAERYLDEMFQDKLFLQRLKKHHGVKSPNNIGAKKISGLVRKSSKYIHYNQELLRARRPFFLLRLQDAKAGVKLKERQLEREMKLIKYCETEAQNMIGRIKIAVAEHNLRQTIETAEKMYVFCENRSKRSLPNRSSYLLELYALVRDAFYNTKFIRNSMTNEQKEARVAVILGLPRKMCSTDSLIMQFRDHFVDKKKQCQITEERVRHSSTREEVIWLYHELSRLHFDQGKYELSRAYATKCLRECNLLRDDKWILNGMFLMIKVHVANRNKIGAKMELRTCKRIARRIEDEKMDQFIEYCMDVVNDTDMDAIPPSKMLEARTKNIMKLMTSDSLKMKANLIFQRINALPPSKRLSVLPGITYPSDVPEHKKSNIERTIVDEKVKTCSHKQNRRGANFMRLMQNYANA